MSGPQFIHLQSFSRKPNKAGQSVDQVLREAARAPEYSLHVPDPQPAPRVVFGHTPQEVEVFHATMTDLGSTEVRRADGTTARKGIRKDRHTLLTAVASHPMLTEQLMDGEVRPDYDRWVEHNVAWLQKMFGDRLVSVIEHTDEPHPHLHAFILPFDDPACEARLLNPAWVAKCKAEAAARSNGSSDKEAVKTGNAAYKAKGRELQDDYHAAVSVPCGLTRTGPRRRRLSRLQWRAEKEAARRDAFLYQQMEKRLDALDGVLDQQSAELGDRLHQIETLQSEAETDKRAAQEARRTAAAELVAAQLKVAGIIKEANEQAELLRGRALEEAEAQMLPQRHALHAKERELAASTAALHHQAKTFEAQCEATLRQTMQDGVALATHLLLGVVEGTVIVFEENDDVLIADPSLRDRFRTSGLGHVLREIVGAFARLWERAMSRLSSLEQDTEARAFEHAVAPLIPPATPRRSLDRNEP